MDASLFRRINDLADRTAWAHAPMRAFANYGIVLFAVLLLAGWWQSRRASQPQVALAAVVWAGGAALVALGIAQLVNRVVDRARPYAAMRDAHVLIARSADASFPSDHATVAGAVAAGLLLAAGALGSRWLGAIAAFAAAVMAFARIYVGVHYPTDVLVGLAIGALTAVALGPLARRLLVPLAIRVKRTRAGWLIG